MKKGWFIGNFEPTLNKIDQFEAAVKCYNKGDSEKKHYHKVATEYTCIISGSVEMNGITYTEGDIIIMEPGEPTDFLCLEDNTKNLVIKVPSVKNDKFLC